jgi:hypothetical protein
VHLGATDDTDARAIKIFAKPAGGTAHLLVKDDVDAAGNLTVEVGPKVNTTYWATWAGDTRYLARTAAARRLTVQVITKGHLKGYDHVSGDVHIYDAGSNAFFVGSVVPNHAGKRLLFTLMKKTTSGWAKVDAAYFKVQQNGAVGVYLVNLRRNVVYRIAAYFPSDGDHGDDWSSWSLLKFT